MHGVGRGKIASFCSGGPGALKSFRWNGLAARDLAWPYDAGATCQLFVINGAPKTQHISAVINDLEGPETIACIGQLPTHGNLFAYELRVQ